jgi:membrane protein implicated in regulation of membrane protease activity
MKYRALIAGGICLVLGAAALAAGAHDWAVAIGNTHVIVYPGYAIALASLMMLLVAAKRRLLRYATAPASQRSR